MSASVTDTVAFGLGDGSPHGDVVSAKSAGESGVNDTPAAQMRPHVRQSAQEQKALEAARGKEKPLIGDFPPYGGTSVEQWRVEQKRRTEHWEKLTPKEQDEELAERKRRDEEWHAIRPQEKEPAKQ